MTTCMHVGPRRAAAPALLAILALLALGPATAFAAASTVSVRYGNPVTFLSPEIQAMGGTGTALYRGGISALLNPSLLVEEQGMRGDAAGALAEVHEDRFQPLFDTFGSYVTDTAIATNRHDFWSSSFGFAGRVPQAPLDLTLGLSLADRYDFAYEFDEELRNPSPFDVAHRDELLEDRQLKIDGAVRALSFGAGASAAPFLSIGAAVNYAFGDREAYRSRRFYTTPDSSRTAREEFDLSGVNFTLGLRARAGNRVQLGFAYESPLKVDGDLLLRETSFEAGEPVIAEAEGDLAVRYPRRWRAGFAFFPRSEPRTVFTVEAELQEWSRLKDDSLPGDQKPVPRLQDALDVRVGVEHRFYNETVARFGFRHYDEYADREAGTSAFTGGLGFPVASGEVAFSVEVSKMTSVQGHWFPYPTAIGTETYVVDQEARVETTQFTFGFGYTRAF